MRTSVLVKNIIH